MRVWIPKMRTEGTVLRTRDGEYLIRFDDYRLTSPDWVPIKMTKPLAKNPSHSFEARAVRAIRKGEKFLVSLPARLRGKRKR